jgi:hypothetical protein
MTKRKKLTTAQKLRRKKEWALCKELAKGPCLQSVDIRFAFKRLR